MVERRPWLTLLAHLVLLLGVAAVALPVYITFVASTRSNDQIIHPPMPMTPGSHLVENYRELVAFYRSAAERGDGAILWLS